MSCYADSSFLVSCYLLDTNTPVAKAYLSGVRAPLLWTALHALEVRNAFELGVFRGLLTTAEVAGDQAAIWRNSATHFVRWRHPNIHMSARRSTALSNDWFGDKLTAMASRAPILLSVELMA